MPKQHTHYCPIWNEHVSIEAGLEQCIKDHQCFSDDPCPLQALFEQDAMRTMQPNKPNRTTPARTLDKPLANPKTDMHSGRSTA